MTEQKVVETVEPDDNMGVYTTGRQRRRARRAALRADRAAGGWGWVSGLLLIGLGALFLLQNYGFFTEFSNWWALFLLLPAAGSFSAARGTYQREGSQWTQRSIGLLLSTLLILGLMVVFLFNLNLSFFGPVLLIGAGLLVLFGPR